MNMVKKLLVSFFGLGYLPIAPGTWGSFGAAVVFFGLALAMGKAPQFSLWILTAILAVIAAVVGIALGRWSCAHYQSDDPKPFVLDEVAGQWIAVLFLPFAGITSLVLLVAVQFFLFRVFDVIKPPPARQAEDLPFGWGIVTDDLLAGIYANLVGQVIFRYLLPLWT